MMGKFRAAWPGLDWKKIVPIIFLAVYLAGGLFTFARQMLALPFPLSIFMDFGFYQQALERALSGGDMYAVHSVGEAYLYPPPALLVVDLFNLVPDFYFRAALFGAASLLMAGFMVYVVARRYALGWEQVWYWFPLVLGFSPLLITVATGQINMLTQFGLVLLFVYEASLPGLAGFGLAVAVMTKVTPLFFGAYLLATRNGKAILWTSVSLVGLALLALLRYGVQPFFIYPDIFRELLGLLPVGTNGQALAAHLVRLGVANPRPIQFGLTVSLLAMIVLAAYVTFRNGQREPLFIVTALAMMLSPNILWYHHYVFFLLPLLVWMGWQQKNSLVTLWCLAGMLLVQFDYFLLSGGLLIHIFGYVSILIVLAQGMRRTTVDPGSLRQQVLAR